MKYVAIFKDSLREALDGKIIYFMFALSALIILFVGSISFRPVPVADQFETVADLTNWAVGKFTGGKGPRVGIAEFAQTNDAPEPWKGAYRLVYFIDAPDQKMLDEMRKHNMVPPPAKLQADLQQQYPWIDQLSVKEIAGKPTEVRYQVEIGGTKVTDRRQWPHEPRVLFGLLPLPLLQGPLAGQVELITDKGIGWFGAGIAMLLSIVITAFFIPNMLRKGTIDLLLAKPLHRTTLLLAKFLGGMVFMALNTAVIMGGLFLVLGLRTDMWLTSLLWCILIFTFQFAIFYSLSTLMAVLTRSPIVCILSAVAFWGVLFLFGLLYRYVDAVRPEKVAGTVAEKLSIFPAWAITAVDVAHVVLPHYKDLDVLTTRLIRQDMIDPNSPEAKKIDEHMENIRWERSIPITLGFIGVMLGLSCWWFARHDY